MTIKFDLADTTMVKSLFKGIFATLEGDFPKSVASKDKTVLKTEKSSTGKKELPKESVLSKDEDNLAKEMAAKKQAEGARISALADDFAAIIPSHTLSPAEIQGFLLKHKRDAAAAVSGAEQWVKDTLAQKEKSKQLEKEKAKETKKQKRRGKGKEALQQWKKKITEEPIVNGVKKESMTNWIEKRTMANGIDRETMTNGIGKDTSDEWDIDDTLHGLTKA